MTNLLGLDVNYVTAALALGIVIVLIVLAVWLIKLLGDASRTVGRGRQKRLAIIDSIAIDQKRQLVLIRRDEVEYLIVTGGPNDLVVDSGFPVPALTPPRGARRMSQVDRGDPAKDTESDEEPTQPRAEVARLRALNGKVQAKRQSLRHTGLLRSVEDDRQLVGGNDDNRATEAADSAKSGYAHHAEDGRGDAAPDAGRTDYAEDGKTRQ